MTTVDQRDTRDSSPSLDSISVGARSVREPETAVSSIDTLGAMTERLPPHPWPEGDTWVLRGNPNPPSTVVRPESVLAALLACLASHPEGASLATCEAAVQQRVVARRLKGNHPVIPLMCWAATNRGIEFTCLHGIVARTLPSAGIRER